MIKNNAYKFRIYPNQDQITLIIKTFGCCRLYHNLALDKIYKTFGEERNIKRKITYPSFYKKQDKYFFMKEIDSLSLANEQLDTMKAFKNYDSEKSEKPRFKSKHELDKSYTTNNINSNIRIENNKIRLPKLGLLRMRKHRILKGEIKNVTVSQDSCNRFYVSICTELEIEEIKKVKPIKYIGLDYSSPSCWIDSNGYSPNLKFYRKYEEKVKRNDKKLSRKVLHSQNWKKQLNKNNKVHSKIANSRKDVLHKESKKYVDNYDVICFEDIDLRGFAKALKLGKSTLDNGFGMFRNFVKYKAENQGKYFIKIPKNYPSTQTCSNCGNVKDKENKLKLSDRVYHCNVCGFTKDRDVNAALNIMKKGRNCLDSLLNKLSIESCS